MIEANFDLIPLIVFAALEPRGPEPCSEHVTGYVTGFGARSEHVTGFAFRGLSSGFGVWGLGLRVGVSGIIGR